MYFTILCCFYVGLFILFRLIISQNKSSKTQPPGPPGWPLIGNMLDVGKTPHINLQKLHARYGPVIWLKIGMCNNLVVQTAKAAEELFTRNDRVFSDRGVFESLKPHDYYKGSMGFAPNGEYWRMVRKLSLSELFLPKRMNASAKARERCIDIGMQWMKEDSEASLMTGGSGDIELEKYLTLIAYNVLGNYVLSKDITTTKENEMCEALSKTMEWLAEPNLADCFPFLKWLDPQGVRSNVENYMGRSLTVINRFVKERIQERLSAEIKETKDLLDGLLDCKGNGETDRLSEKEIAAIIVDMFLAGTHSTSSTINWGMAQLLHNQKSMEILRNELDHVIGRSRSVEESDLNDLPYLQAVVKETLRLHSFPALIPRKSIQNTTFMGYFVPKNTLIHVNTWAIHMDPRLWEDPYSFKPERFLDSTIDFKGKHYSLLPFGSGRRSCVGMLLGHKMVSLTLAKLIHGFNWKLPANESYETMDMRVGMGAALRKLVPLKVIPIER